VVIKNLSESKQWQSLNYMRVFLNKISNFAKGMVSFLLGVQNITHGIKLKLLQIKKRAGDYE
jgi:hypothetical protein